MIKKTLKYHQKAFEDNFKIAIVIVFSLLMNIQTHFKIQLQALDMGIKQDL
jgi:hypothetical protein